jgi:hypothetical protein
MLVKNICNSYEWILGSKYIFYFVWCEAFTSTEVNELTRLSAREEYIFYLVIL